MSFFTHRLVQRFPKFTTLTDWPVLPRSVRIDRSRRRRCIDEIHSLTYTVLMKNITLSVNEKVLAAVRRVAADNDTTVNAIVREHLTALAEHADRAALARKRIRELSEASEARMGSAKWSRDELHDR